MRSSPDPVRLLLRLLLSRNAAILAMVALAAILAAASLAPDGEALERLRASRPRLGAVLERVRPAEVSRSPLVVALLGWVGLGVGASMVTRVRARAGATRRPGPAPLERFVARRRLELPLGPAEAERAVRQAFRAARLPLGPGLDGGRGRAGFWGSMAFHGGLLVTLLGIGLSATGRFAGELVLAEGYPVVAHPASFLRAEPAEVVLRLWGWKLGVSQVDASYAQGTQLTDVSAVLTVERPGAAPERHFASVNVPVELEGLQFTVHAYGYAPEIEAVDPTGRVRASGHALLRLLPPGREDAIPLAGGGALRFRFFPDHEQAAGQHRSRTLQPLSPALQFRWFERDRLAAQGLVRQGETLEVAGHRVRFAGLARWADFLVTRDPGLPWFAAGTFCAILGLALRFFLHEQGWRASLAAAGAGTAVELVLSARYYPALLEVKADALAARLARG